MKQCLKPGLKYKRSVVSVSGYHTSFMHFLHFIKTTKPSSYKSCYMLLFCVFDCFRLAQQIDLDLPRVLQFCFDLFCDIAGKEYHLVF